MHFTGEIPTPKNDSRLDLIAAMLLILVLAVATLFPENFVTGVPVFASQRSFPLTLLLPFAAVWGVVYIVARRKLIKPGVVDGLVIAFMAYIFLRNISGLESFVVFKFAVFGVFIFYASSLLTENSERLLRIVIYVILGLLLLTAVYGLVEYVFQKNFIYAKYISESVREPIVGLHRIGSTLAHPVSYGAFLIQALPFSVLVWLQSRGRVRILAVAATIAGVLALFFTYSKGSWIVAVVVSLGALLLVRGRMSRKYLLPAIIVAALIISLVAIFWQQIVSETEIRSFESFDVRLSAWRAAIAGFADHPVIGVGYKQGSGELKKHISPTLYEGLYPDQPVDNNYLSQLLEAGIIGFALWILVLMFVILEGVGVARARSPGSPLALAALASIIGISLNMMTFESLQLWPNFVFFWLAAGILHGLAMRRGPAAGHI